MNIRQQLPLEQQFELQVFESQVKDLSQEDAHQLLIQMREAMLHQTVTFREMLKDAWGIGQNVDGVSNLLTDS
ncbi:NblA/ycf18 family protein [Lyngbya confervoides]|uniref:NblA/ycf18 family protein n=1 Tax=Lyngbya confervoides BDU141951 TaxID=1574623 RepID=A0ABD4TBK9_9CYAN|nr:NblA/ycf18 family protein [Lyngbya confervoides]MCM1985270.1 NblA/ycf18 family protein [Lyngbya confervoides BDU141951]